MNAAMKQKIANLFSRWTIGCVCTMQDVLRIADP